MNLPRSPYIRAILSALLCTAATFLCGSAQNPATQSVLSTGRWVKIHVDSSAIYKIDRATLAKWGFSNPAKVYLYGYGSVENAHNLDTAPSDLPPLPVLRTSDGMIFYGEGDMRILPSSANAAALPVRNYYSRGSYYFLSDVAPDSEPEVGTFPYTPAPDATPLTTHLRIDFRKPEELNIHNAGVFFFSEDLSRGKVKEYSFDIPEYDSGGTFGFRYVGNTSAVGKKIGLSFSSDVKTSSLILSNLTRATDVHTLYTTSSKTFSVTPISEASDAFTVKFFSPSADDFSLLAVDYLYYTFRRKNIFHSPGIRMEFYNTTSTPVLSMTGVPADLTLWDVTTPRTPVSLIPEIDNTGSTLLASLPSRSGASRVFAFSPSASLPSPSFCGVVPNSSLHSMQGVDFLIVTVPPYRQEAERLARAHREYQGLSVAVVEQQEIFNEFSSGAPHPNAIRKFARMLYRRTDTPLKHLLLFGCGTYDNRRVTINDGIDYLITYEVEHLDNAASNAKDYCSDQYFGMFPDRIPDNLGTSSIPVNIGVGRVPVLNISEAKEYVDKCVTYLSDPAMAGDYHHSLLIADYGNSNEHLINGAESSASVIKSLVPGATLTKLYEALYPHNGRRSEAIYNALKLGVASTPRIINYTGHADINSLGMNIILSAANEKRLTYGSLPILFLATCNPLPIDNPYRGIGSQILMKSSGPVAAIGSAREVYINYNHNFNDEFLRQYYRATADDRIGDVYRRAYNTSSDISARRLNNLCYNLVGDPALPVYAPSYGITINGPDGSAISLTPLTKVKLSGTVTASDGSAVNDFNGQLTLSLYAPASTMESYIHSSTDTRQTITLDETLLSRIVADVTNGEWEAELLLPETAPEGKCRLTCYAVSTASRKLATATLSDVSILPPPASAPDIDTLPPEITLYLNKPETADGAEVGASAQLYVNISDRDSGVDLNRSSVGTAPSITLDGSQPFADATQLMRATANGGASLVYPLTGLTDGEHTIRVTARDLAGNSTSESLTFTVINSDIDISLEIDNQLAREAAEFEMHHPLSSTPTARLMILDMSGNTVFSKSDITFPFRWNLTDNAGNKVPDGTYRASVLIKSYPRFAASPEVVFTVVKHLTQPKDK